ncbi:hypothetical protein ACHHV8_36655 [Paenibacillus sp. TAB 01]|uniref:hypothetical protein n=1 Tax=Paenibacillus sp. TAB 01 TaxID=3368988 RepID=UPI0037500216
MSDSDLYMVHHYVQRGHALSDLLGLDAASKRFMKVSMLLHYEEEAKRWGNS